MATIKDIAARSGVSIATVSKHINGIPVKESNRRRIDEAIRELGYQVNAAARALKTRRSMTVGILLDSLSNPFYTTVISSVEEYLRENGYAPDINDTRLHHEIYLSDARRVPPEKWKTVIRHPIKKAEG